MSLYDADLHRSESRKDALRTVCEGDELLAKQKPSGRRRPHCDDPRTGDVLASSAGASNSHSQSAIAQTDSPDGVQEATAAFEGRSPKGRRRTPEVCHDEQRPSASTIRHDPANYDGQYEGAITLRRALALSRNIATVKVAETAGYDQVAALWKRVGVGTTPRAYPSIALGVFEATPFQIATAYTVFPNGGTLKPLRAISRIVSAGENVPVKVAPSKTIARKDTTYSSRTYAERHQRRQRGQRPARPVFVRRGGESLARPTICVTLVRGLQPELLTVVWVGLDDNMPSAERLAGGAADRTRS